MNISKFNAKVSWFDNKSGEGMVKLDNGSLAYIHWSTIANSINTELNEPFKNEKKVWCILFEGQELTVRVILDGHINHVYKVFTK